MGVLVRVDVGDAEARVLQPAELGGGFGGDFDGADAEGEEVADERDEAGAERLAVGAEGGDLFGGQCRGAVHKEDVAADFELRVGVSGGDGIVEEGGCGHEGGGGERVGAVEFGDGAVDAGSEAEVVGVDDEGHEIQRTAFSDQRSGVLR